MKRKSEITKNKTNKEDTKNSEYKNKKDGVLYVDGGDTEIVIGYDPSKHARYVQIHTL